MRFKYAREKYLTSNQLTIVIVKTIPAEEETKAPTIPEINEEKVTPKKVYYHGVYVIIHFNNKENVDKEEEQD